MDDLPITMVMFDSYVSLLEGMCNFLSCQLPLNFNDRHCPAWVLGVINCDIHLSPQKQLAMKARSTSYKNMYISIEIECMIT